MLSDTANNFWTKSGLVIDEQPVEDLEIVEQEDYNSEIFDFKKKREVLEPLITDLELIIGEYISIEEAVESEVEKVEPSFPMAENEE